ncbi:hypothetical protein T12_11237, partial [Trichinella patagoniensis]
LDILREIVLSLEMVDTVVVEAVVEVVLLVAVVGMTVVSTVTELVIWQEIVNLEAIPTMDTVFEVVTVVTMVEAFMGVAVLCATLAVKAGTSLKNVVVGFRAMYAIRRGISLVTVRIPLTEIEMSEGESALPAVTPDTWRVNAQTPLLKLVAPKEWQMTRSKKVKMLVAMCEGRGRLRVASNF